MEYRLNKIDTDLRRKINEAASESKIHPKKEIQVNKDKEEKNGRQQAEEYKEEYKHGKQNKNRKIIINAEKICNVNIDGFIGDEKELKIKKGIFLDIKK